MKYDEMLLVEWGIRPPKPGVLVSPRVSPKVSPRELQGNPCECVFHVCCLVSPRVSRVEQVDIDVNESQVNLLDRFRESPIDRSFGILNMTK